MIRHNKTAERGWRTWRRLPLHFDARVWAEDEEQRLLRARHAQRQLLWHVHRCCVWGCAQWSYLHHHSTSWCELCGIVHHVCNFWQELPKFLLGLSLSITFGWVYMRAGFKPIWAEIWHMSTRSGLESSPFLDICVYFWKGILQSTRWPFQQGLNCLHDFLNPASTPQVEIST